MTRHVAGTAFLVGVASLMYELTQVRMLAFLLSASMDFLAIPLALLGLAIGSMFCHFVWRGSLESLVTWAARGLFPVMTVCLISVFVVMDTWFSDVQVHQGYARPLAEATRLVVYALVFLPPYMLFGALLAALFSANADRIGRLYFFDLAGAALGCALAPTLLTLTDLPQTLCTVIGVTLLLFLLHSPGLRVAQGGAVAAFVVVVGLAGQGLLLREHPDPTFLSSGGLGPWIRQGKEIAEVDVRWNEVARTALMKVIPDGPYAIIQDNGLSNVSVQAFRPERRGEVPNNHRALAWRMGLDPKSVLVVFAGMARDMVIFDVLANGEADIVGVELNPDVVKMASHPALASFHVDDFLAEPNIRLVNAEGRAFLERDTGTYDLIHVANNGAVNSLRTGHTRKFLDTEECMAAYLGHLSAGGMIVFSNQPISEKAEAFQRLLPDPGASIAIWGPPPGPSRILETLVVKPSGLTPHDVSIIEQVAKAEHFALLQAPGRPGTLPLGPRVTDDRPFTRGLGLSQLEVIPSKVPPPWLLSSWVKVFTVVLFGAVSGVVGLAAVAFGGQRARVPAGWVAFLLLSGVGYMCVEIGLIAKTELVLGNPLYSVAINLALFLVSNAVGSAIQDRWSPLRGPLELVVAVLMSAAWALAAIYGLTGILLSAPLVIKVAGIAVITAPVGVVLGMFYPFCVGHLSRAGLGAAVPMTYGLTTLASVLGSSLAMTAIIDLGFTRVIVLGTLAYGLAGLAAWRVLAKKATTGVLRR